MLTRVAPPSRRKSSASNGHKDDSESGAIREIFVPKIQVRGLMVPIEGISELITDNGASAVAAMKANEARKQGPKKPLPPRDPEQSFKDSIYWFNEKKQTYGFPALGIKKCLVSAGGRFGEEQMVRLYGLLNIEAPGGLLELIAKKPEHREDFVRRGGLTPDIEYRAAFFPWRINVPITFLDGYLSEAAVLNLFELAGQSVGLGNWRPEKKGISGRFRFIADEVKPL